MESRQIPQEERGTPSGWEPSVNLLAASRQPEGSQILCARFKLVIHEEKKIYFTVSTQVHTDAHFCLHVLISYLRVGEMICTNF